MPEGRTSQSLVTAGSLAVMKGSFGNATDKKVPENKKYANVKSSIDTGASASKQDALSSAAVAKRRDEIFKRIKASTLVRLIQERNVNESIYAMGPQGEGDGASASSVMASKAAPTKSHAATSVATVGSVAGTVVSVCDTDTTVSEARDLILLDLREPEDFERCRLPLAVSYPATKVNRDQFTPDLHRCKRDPSKLLVVYHSNDQATAGVAALLVQKGWESAHALSGGFEEIVQSYPEIVEGDIPSRPNTGATTRSSKAGSRR